MRSERKSDNEEIDRSVQNMIDSYGEPDEPLPVSVNEWIYATYDFINAVLSGYYDVKKLGFDIILGIEEAYGNPDANINEYVRGINAGG